MHNPGTAYHFRTVRPPSQRYAGMAFVGAIHVARSMRWSNGLAVKLVKHIPPVIETAVIDVEQPKKPEPLPQPAKPTVEMPTIDTVPEPVIQIDTASRRKPTQVTRSTRRRRPIRAAGARQHAHDPALSADRAPARPAGRGQLHLTIVADGRVRKADIVQVERLVRTRPEPRSIG